MNPKRSGLYALLVVGVFISLNLEMYLRGADFFVFLFVDFGLVIVAHLALFVIANRKPRP